MLDVMRIIVCFIVGFSGFLLAAVMIQNFFQTREINRRMKALEATDSTEAERLRLLENSGLIVLKLSKGGGLSFKPYA